VTNLDALLAGIVQEPREETRWLVLADWLEEYDDPRRAELLRLHRKLLATCCEPWKHAERAEWQARVVKLLEAGVKPCVPARTLELSPGVSMTFNFVPPGSFLFGVVDNGKPKRGKKQTKPTEIKKGFYLGTHEVTRAQWYAIMGAPGEPADMQRPVDNVSWNDAQRFCRAVATKAKAKLRLPLEAEWEWACRAGTTTAYYFGDVVRPDLMNCDARSSKNRSRKGKFHDRTTDVGTYPPNPWGLYDMHGNLWEWCADRGEAYDEAEQGAARIMRGGCWDALPTICTSASRVDSGARYGGEYDGIRVCLR
jgi:uncharacterized protein (TIGR02996 family)